jgi:GntR family transcriptional regulator
MTNNGVHPIKASRLSLSAQTQQYLLGLVEGGRYQPGEQLPGEKELAAQLGISRATLREALLNLEQDGVVVRRHGIGTFVAPGFGRRLEGGLERLESVLELAARQKLQVQVSDLEVRQAEADVELAGMLQVQPGTLLTDVRRVVMMDGKPVAYMVDMVLATVLSPADVDGAFSGSVLDLLRQKPDRKVAQAMADILAISADRFLVQKLKVSLGQALLLLEETVFDDTGLPLEFSRNYFIPDFFQFRVVRR